MWQYNQSSEQRQKFLKAIKTCRLHWCQSYAFMWQLLQSFSELLYQQSLWSAGLCRCIGWDFYKRQKTKSHHLCPKKCPQSSTSGLPMPENRTTLEKHIVHHQMTFLLYVKRNNAGWGWIVKWYMETWQCWNIPNNNEHETTVINNLWNCVQRKQINEPVPEEIYPWTLATGIWHQHFHWLP